MKNQTNLTPLQETVIEVLNAHGVKTKIENNEVYALEEWTFQQIPNSKWILATNYSMKETLLFLNY